MPPVPIGKYKRACDACHIRRTKCSGTDPCERCSISDLICTRLKKPAKKGPAGKVIAEIKALQSNGGIGVPGGEPQETASDPPGHASGSMQRSAVSWPHNPLQDSDSDPATGLPLPLRSVSERVPATLSQFAPLPSAHHTGTLVTPTTTPTTHEKASFLRVIDPILRVDLKAYFHRVYPLCPIVDPISVMSRLETGTHLYDKSFAALILALASLALALPNESSGSDDRSDVYIAHALEFHNTPKLGIEPTLETVATSMTIAAFSRARYGADAAYLRNKEAVGLADLLQLHQPQRYYSFSEDERGVALNIFWILAVAERSTSLINMKPITFRSRMMDVGSTMHSATVFAQRLRPITMLFDQIDPSLVECINLECPRATAGSFCAFDTSQALATQQNLEAVDPIELSTHVQRADLELTRLWLQIKVWQACISHSMLECFSVMPALRVDYPYIKVVETARCAKRYHYDALKGNGRCMGIKLRCVADAAQLVLDLPNPPVLHDTYITFREVAESVACLLDIAARLDETRWIRFEEPTS